LGYREAIGVVMLTEDKKKNTNFQISGNGKKLHPIQIEGARQHNLKNVRVALPRNHFIVVTGVSGSGKSSLTIDTLYAEGQRRYVESLSSYARQFLSRMDKPEVDYIRGLVPAIAIEQKVSTRTTRSTVGSLTEIYDYLRLLFARIGTTYSPVSGEQVRKHEVSDVTDYVFNLPEGEKVFITTRLPLHNPAPVELSLLQQRGFARILLNGEVVKVEEATEAHLKSIIKAGSLELLVDRIVVKHEDEDLRSRLADSVLTAMNEGNKACTVRHADKQAAFSARFEADGMVFESPEPSFFHFNNPYGACRTCEGFGSVMGIDESLVFPNKTLSVYEGAIAPWRGEKMSEWVEPLLRNGIRFDFPIHRSYCDLNEQERALLWSGNEYFKGLHEFFRYLEEKSYKIQYRVMMSRYRGKTVCPDCLGSRIRKDAQYVKINGRHIGELLMMPVSRLKEFFETFKAEPHQEKVAGRILREINNRIDTMLNVGLGYLSLNRISNTLSGGETQRINLTRSIGSNLTSSMYILDEPSIGLHQRDTERLIHVLKNLRNLGNTLVIVEHDEDIMRAADHIVDMGPEAGIHGGQLMYNGPYSGLSESNSLTARYLRGELEIPVPAWRRKSMRHIELQGASQFNLKDVSVRFPLQAMTVVSGVSGSGKTTLIKKILYPALMRHFDSVSESPGAHRELSGDLKAISMVELIDQNPLGRSSRSNPVTYVKAYDGIRELYARQHLSKVRGFQPKDFSFNVEGGRCESCKGEGVVVVEMQFLADVHLRCEECNGRKFKEDVLEVTYKEKSIYDILEMSVEEALSFFAGHQDIVSKLQPLQNVGLGYIRLGQSSSTLSGGEAQRLKLASYLSKGQSQQPVFFIFDEPTTGLHFHDIARLLDAFNQLINNGHTVVVIEHNMDVIKCADWLIDLGPEGGDEGGRLLYQGIPEGLPEVKESHTGRFLKEKLK